ncbi:MAG: hypothetical protein Greene041619_469 [Candidatus Peregrinibacteria bacterium Greene0416_19]|nr:MAG: hypothetical protein Greene041619_469 [Candidatus Peregrinibacteria bacterium Greene0416_19]
MSKLHSNHRHVRSRTTWHRLTRSRLAVTVTGLLFLAAAPVLIAQWNGSDRLMLQATCPICGTSGGTGGATGGTAGGTTGGTTGTTGGSAGGTTGGATGGSTGRSGTPAGGGQCERNEALFTSGNGGNLEQWVLTYHNDLRRIVSAHLRPQSPICTGNVTSPPSQDLRTLAAKLKPWKTPAAMQALTEQDMGAVLLEYLREYECAMREARDFLPADIATAFGSLTPLTGAGLAGEGIRRASIIQQELSIPRAALHRTLLFLAGTERLQPLSMNLACLERASLDIRNVLGLAAETSACLPRIWDARGSLRNPPPNR